MVESFTDSQEADRFKVIFEMEMKLADNIIEDDSPFMTAKIFAMTFYTLVNIYSVYRFSIVMYKIAEEK